MLCCILGEEIPPRSPQKERVQIMELKDNCIILLEKATQKVKCYKFLSMELNRELALHEDSENKNYSSVTDIKTGLRLFGIPLKTKDVKEELLKTNLEKFIRHFTKDTILTKLQNEEQVPMQEKIRKKVK